MNDGNTLRGLLESRGISVNDYKKILSNAGLTERTAQNFLSAEELSTPNLCLLCSLFGFGPENFSKSPDLFYSSYSSNKETIYYSYNIKRDGKEDFRPWIENFVRCSNEYLLKAKYRLYVCDYIEFLFISSEDYFTEEAQKYYTRLEERLDTHPQLSYRRASQLPLHSKSESYDEIMGEFLNTVSLIKLKHICRCLRDFPTQCRFQVIARPLRTHTFYIVDEKYILSEYFSFDKYGYAHPDTLFVETCQQNAVKTTASDKFFKSCVTDFELITETTSNLDYILTEAVVLHQLALLNSKIRVKVDSLNQEHQEVLKSIHSSYRESIDQVSKARLDKQQLLIQIEKSKKREEENLEKIRIKQLMVMEVFNIA